MNSDSEKQLSFSVLDPSALTTQFVWREIQSLKELQSQSIDSVKEGIRVAHDDLVRVPTEVQKAIAGLQALMETKIAYESKIVDIKIGYEIKIKNLLNEVVNKNFERVEAHRLEYKADSTQNIQSALTASRELNKQTTENIILIVGRNEAMFTKLIDSLGNTMHLAINNLRESIGDLKTNQSTNQGSSTGKTQQSAWILAVGGFLFGLISIIVLLIKFLGGR